MDIPAITVSLADASYIYYSTDIPFNLKLCGNLQYSPSIVSKTVHVVCSVLCHVLPNVTSDMVLGIYWLYAINPLIDWNNYSLSMVCEGEIYVFWVPNKAVFMLILRFLH